jgi:hypothetical protein
MAQRQPVYDLHRVLSLRDKLCEDLVFQFSQETGSVALLPHVVAVLRKHLPTSISERAVKDSLVDTIGKPLDRPFLRQLAWRIAGNLPRLRKGKAATPWLCQRQEEKSPAVILHVEKLTREMGRGDSRQKETGGMVTFEVQAGTQAGLRLRKWWTTRFVARHRQVFGFARFSRRPDRCPPGKPFLGFEDVRQLGQLRVQLRFTADSCKDGLDFDGFACPASALEYNRQLLTLRTRSTDPCPVGYQHACHVCSVGLDRCRASCHPLSYQRRACQECQKPDAYFDPALRRSTCVECTARPPAENRRSS